MTSLDEPRELDAIDTAFHLSGILLRVAGYAVVSVIAQHYSCGPAILTGVLAGDLLGQFVKILLHLRDNPLQQVCELALVGLVLMLTHTLLAWPDDQAMRAIVGLAGFGVVTAHVGGAMLTRFGPSTA